MKPGNFTSKFKFLSCLLLTGGLFASTNANAQPANDDCSGAIVLSVGTACSPVAATTLDATLSSAPMPDCGSDPTGDVWFKFTAPAGVSSVDINFNSISGSEDIVAQVYESSDNSCAGTFSNLECDDDGGAGTFPQFGLLSVTAGNTYFIRVWSYDEGVYDDFSICVFQSPATVPACTSLLLPIGGATDVSSVAASPQFVWNSVTGAVSYEFFIGETIDEMFSLGEFSDTFLLVNGMESLMTYFWYVVPVNSLGSATGCESGVRSFSTGEVLPPSNDECVNAVGLSTGSTISGYNINATNSTLPGGACSDIEGIADANDVWYSLTADYDGTIDIVQSVPDGTDLVLEVLSGTCGVLTEEGCAASAWLSGENFVSFSATEGTTYYIRTYGWSGTEEGIFTIDLAGDALPVPMNELKGKIANNRAQLFWNTFSEQNNRGFEIQRSVDGKQFSKVGFVASHAANGNSTQNLAYNFTDATSIIGAVYYRLQQIDIDGKTALSNVVRLSATDNNKSLSIIVATPNPVANNLKVSIAGNRAENGLIQIADITGKVLKSIAVNAADISVDMVDVASGVYFVRYNDNLQSQVIKIVKQ